MSRQRILNITLVISLLANAFFVGYAVSRFLDDPADRSRGGILRAVGARLTKNLDDDSRQQVSVALDALQPAYGETLEKRRDNYQQLRNLLAEPQANRTAIDAVIVDMQNQSSDLVLQVHEKAVDAILALPADKRAEITGRE